MRTSPILTLAALLLLAGLFVTGSSQSSAQTLTILHSFGDGSVANDGFNSEAGLVEGTDGNLYGTTVWGGAYNDGTVFRITPSGGYSILHSFDFDRTSQFDGAYPEANLVEGSDGSLYGTTTGGGEHVIYGEYGGGTVFRITPTGGYSILHNFDNRTSSSDGAYPEAGVVEGSDGNLYGTTAWGGEYGGGTVFRITPTGVYSILHSFDYDGTSSFDGTSPYGGVVESSDGSLYGTTTGGGEYGDGTVFRITPTGVYSILHSFDYDGTSSFDGTSPYGGVVESSDGSLYGTTTGGGEYGDGTVFRITPTGVYLILHSFDYDGTTSFDGTSPYAGLVEGSDGSFYGTTLYGGGGYDEGTVFRITPSGGYSILHSFDGGASTYAGLIQGSDGSLYGTTYYDGSASNGSVFRLGLDSAQAFDASDQDTGVDLSDQNVANLAEGAAGLTAQTAGGSLSPADGSVPNFDYSDFRIIKAAVADGVTKVLLQCATSGPGMVTFTEQNGVTTSTGALADHLRQVGSFQAPTNVSTQLANGQYAAYAVYTVPESLDTTTEAQANPGHAVSHTVTFAVSFTPSGSTTPQTLTPVSLTLQSPPILLVHGWLGSADTWIKSGLEAPFGNVAQFYMDSGFNVFEADYSDHNNDALANLQNVLLGGGTPIAFNGSVCGIKDILNWYHSQGIAITKVDVVAHSYGGLVTREFESTGGDASTVADFHSNRIRRFVTLGTPHFGSPLATALDTVTGHGTNLFGGFFAVAGYPYGLAVRDFEPGSAAIASLKQANIPAFAEVGNIEGSSDFLVANVLPAIAGIFANSDIFGGDASDGVVSETSQKGGLTSQFNETPGISHLQMTNSLVIAANVASLLTGPVSAFSPTGFPTVSSTPPSLTITTAPQMFSITWPTSGLILQAGATVPVDIVPGGGETINEWEVNGGSFSDEDDDQTASPSNIGSGLVSYELTIPANAAGQYPVTVTASDTAGNVSMQQVVVTVQNTATLVGLLASSYAADVDRRAHPLLAGSSKVVASDEPVTSEQLSAIIFSNIGSVSQLNIEATYSDGSVRSITQGSTGTVYATSDPTVATVTTDGLVTAVGNGDAQITATNGKLSSVANVAVNAATPEILAVVPNFGALGSTSTVSIIGYDLGGATSLAALLGGEVDSGVTFSNIAATADGTSLTAQVSISGSAAAGMRTLMVATPGGGSSVNATFDSAGYTVSPASPTIISFSPMFGPIGTGVTLTGTGLGTATAVAVNGVSATLARLSDTSLYLTVPSGASTGNITVTTGGGTATTSVNYIVDNPRPLNLLWSHSPDNEFSLWSLEGTTPTYQAYGPFAGWKSIALASGPDGVAHILQDHTSDHQISIWAVNPDFTYTYQAYAASAGWVPTDITVTPDNHVHVLVTHPADGEFSVWDMTSPTSVTYQAYGPYPGWVAKGIAEDPDGDVRLLLDHPSDHEASIWDMVSPTQFTYPAYGPYSGWEATGMAVGPDEHVHVLWNHVADGSASVWDMASPTSISNPVYGPYSGGWTAQGISVTDDGDVHVQWVNPSGVLSLWDMASATSITNPVFGPYSGWSVAEIGDH